MRCLALLAFCGIHFSNTLSIERDVRAGKFRDGCQMRAAVECEKWTTVDHTSSHAPSGAPAARLLPYLRRFLREICLI